MEQTKNKYLYYQISISIIFFIISASYGWLIRLQHVLPFQLINPANFLQAHSHVTFLGWGFLTSISLITAIFLSADILNYKILRTSYGLMVLTLASLLISFPLQGYKLFSILFLTIFLLSSYVFLFYIYKRVRKLKTVSSKFITSGILYYVLSSIAIWLVPVIIVKIGKGEIYQNAIYFYLHFLYNGYFVFVLFGLLIIFFEKRKISFSSSKVNKFYFLTHFACVPAYALSLLWANTSFVIVSVGMVSAVIQLFSLIFLVHIFKKLWDYIPHKPMLRLFLLVVSISYYLKIFMQFLGACPYFTNLAKDFRPYLIIGYLHLFTLGFMSLFLFLLLYVNTKFKIHKLGLFLLVLGIVLSETLFFTQGLLMSIFEKGITNYSLYLFIASTFMPSGLLFILYNHIKTRNYQLAN